MPSILAALAPIFLLILCGYGLRRSGLFGEAFWAEADRLVFLVLFPVYLVLHIGTADLAGLALAPMALGLLAGLVAMSVLAVALRPAFRVDGPAFASIFQGSMRPNTYVAFAAAEALFGATGSVLAAIAVAVCTPAVNVLAVLALARWGRNGNAGGWRMALRTMARNPIILAVAAGLLINVAGIGLPPVIDDMMAIVARATLPMALLSVGAGLQFRAAGNAGGPVAAAAILKLLGLPALTWAACAAFGAEGLPLTVAVMFAALPNSPTSYSMTRQLGGNHILMAAIITATTFAAMATMPTVLMVLGAG